MGCFRRLVESSAWLPLGLIAIGMVMAAVVSTQLAHGWAEIPDHWWSTLVVGGPFGLAGLWWLMNRPTGLDR